MEYLMELIVELIYEGSIEGIKRNTPKFIKISLAIILALFFLTVIALILGTGFLMLKNNIAVGLCLILIGIFLVINSVFKFQKVYKKYLKSSEGDKDEKSD